MEKSATRSSPLVSVVVPTLNGGKGLEECLGSIAKQTHHAVQTILVDNASSDGSQVQALKTYPAIHLVQNDANLGFSEACNRGAAVATGDYLLFLNNDVLLADDTLERLTSSAEEGVYQILQPLLLSPDGSVDSAGDLFTWTGFLWHQNDGFDPIKPFPVFAVKGACMLVKRQAFERVGGFVESYFAYFEEADLCWRARMAGYEVGVDPCVKVVHRGGTTTRRILDPEQIYHLSFRNRLRSIMTNPSPGSVVRILPLHVLGCLVTAAVFALTGRVRSGLAILQSLAWPFLHFGMVKQQRRLVQSQRILSDTDVLRRELTVAFSVRRLCKLLLGTLHRWERSHGD